MKSKNNKNLNKKRNFSRKAFLSLSFVATSSTVILVPNLINEEEDKILDTSVENNYGTVQNFSKSNFQGQNFFEKATNEYQLNQVSSLLDVNLVNDDPTSPLANLSQDKLIEEILKYIGDDPALKNLLIAALTNPSTTDNSQTGTTTETNVDKTPTLTPSEKLIEEENNLKKGILYGTIREHSENIDKIIDSTFQNVLSGDTKSDLKSDVSDKIDADARIQELLNNPEKINDEEAAKREISTRIQDIFESSLDESLLDKLDDKNYENLFSEETLQELQDKNIDLEDFVEKNKDKLIDLSKNAENLLENVSLGIDINADIFEAGKKAIELVPNSVLEKVASLSSFLPKIKEASSIVTKVSLTVMASLTGISAIFLAIASSRSVRKKHQGMNALLSKKNIFIILIATAIVMAAISAGLLSYIAIGLGGFV